MLFPSEVLRDIFDFAGGNNLDDLLLVNRQFSATVTRFYSTNRPVRRMFSLDVDYSSFSTVQYEHRTQNKKSFQDFKALMDAIRRDPIKISNIRLFNLQNRYRFRDENVKEREGITHLVRVLNVLSVKFLFREKMPFFKLVRENDHLFIKRLELVKEKNYSQWVRFFFNKKPKPSESYFLSIPHGIQCSKIDLDADEIDVRISDNFIRSGHLWQSAGQSSLVVMNRYLFQDEPEELVDNLLMAFNSTDVRSSFTIVVKEMKDLEQFSIATQFNQRTKEKFETCLLGKDEIEDCGVEFSGSKENMYWVVKRSPVEVEE